MVEYYVIAVCMLPNRSWAKTQKSQFVTFKEANEFAKICTPKWPSGIRRGCEILVKSYKDGVRQTMETYRCEGADDVRNSDFGRR